jgi:hypothetical protein
MWLTPCAKSTFASVGEVIALFITCCTVACKDFAGSAGAAFFFGKSATVLSAIVLSPQ